MSPVHHCHGQTLDSSYRAINPLHQPDWPRHAGKVSSREAVCWTVLSAPWVLGHSFLPQTCTPPHHANQSSVFLPASIKVASSFKNPMRNSHVSLRAEESLETHPPTKVLEGPHRHHTRTAQPIVCIESNNPWVLKAICPEVKSPVTSFCFER